MSINFINPPSPFLINQKAFPPLGILYIASHLDKHGIKARIIDLTEKENQLEEALRGESGPGLYGVTATTPQYPYVKKIKDILKKQNQKNVVIVGGAHPSSLPEKCLEDGFDCVVLGEGENAVLEIAKSYDEGKSLKRLIKHPYIKDIDTIPFPARHLINIKSYGYEIEDAKATTIITSRGCPYECAFCSKEVWQRGTRFHSAGYVERELRSLVSLYGFKSFQFLDDIITLNKNRLLDICSRIGPMGITWRAYVNAKTTDKDMLVAMKEAGCIEVGIGVESGSQKILDNVGKKSTVEENTRIVQECKEVGIMSNVFLLIGLPGETRETVEETRRWMERVRPEKFGFNIFAPYAGTPVYKNREAYDINLGDMPDERSWVKGRQGEYEAFISTKALSTEEIKKLFEELFAYYTDLASWRPGVGRTTGEVHTANTKS